jgi:hypothetical protein
MRLDRFAKRILESRGDPTLELAVAYAKLGFCIDLEGIWSETLTHSTLVYSNRLQSDHLPSDLPLQLTFIGASFANSIAERYSTARENNSISWFHRVDRDQSRVFRLRGKQRKRRVDGRSEPLVITAKSGYISTDAIHSIQGLFSRFEIARPDGKRKSLGPAGRLYWMSPTTIKRYLLFIIKLADNPN